MPHDILNQFIASIYKGWIFGGEHDAQWTQQIFRHKERFQNPLRQNYKHTKTLAELTGIPEPYFKSLVVLAGDCTFKTALPANVVYVQDFVRYIKDFQTPIIKDEQVPEIVSVIGEWAGTVTDKQKAGHVAHVQGKKTSGSVVAKAPACPQCGAQMISRTKIHLGSRLHISLLAALLSTKGIASPIKEDESIGKIFPRSREADLFRFLSMLGIPRWPRYCRRFESIVSSL